MSAQGDPTPESEQAARIRWLGRLAVVAIALWFIFDGLRGLWSGAGVVAQAMIGVAVVLGIAFAVLGFRHLARRGPGD